MLLHSDNQKIQSVTIKPLLSQFPGRYVFTTLTQVCTALGCGWFAVYRTAVALKHNIYDDGGLYKL